MPCSVLVTDVAMAGGWLNNRAREHSARQPLFRTRGTWARPATVTRTSACAANRTADR